MDNNTGPPGRERPGADTGPTRQSADDTTTDSAEFIWSRQVNWWTVHTFVTPFVAEAGSWPMAGSVEWVSLADDDPRKWAAILDAAQHWALRVDACQAAACEASRDVSAALNWSAVSRAIRQHREFYAARPWLRRVAS
jgi:hypothetical protein